MTKLSRTIVVVLALWGIGAGPIDSPALDRLMRQKLIHTQKILEAVVTSDWIALETQSRELERLTDDPAWTSLKYPEFATYSTSFKRAIRDLHEAAVQRDLEATPKAYVAVTLKCVECHRYLMRARIAR